MISPSMNPVKLLQTECGEEKTAENHRITIFSRARINEIITIYERTLLHLKYLDFTGMIAQSLERGSSSSKKIKEFPTIFLPDNLLILRFTWKYLTKYQIHIKQCYYFSLETTIKTFLKEAKQTFGIIYQLHARGHVLPMIFNFQDGRKQVLLLDSLGSPGVHQDTYKSFVTWFTETDFEMFISGDQRQADNRSCRTEALIILRNCLIDLKSMKIADLKDYFLKIHSYDIGPYMVELPPSADYHSQISHKDRDLNAYHVTRDCFSNHASKASNPRTVSEFRNRFNSVVTVKEKIRIPLHTFGFSEDEPRFYREKLDGLSLNLSSSAELKLTLLYQRTINTYLVKKGFENNAKALSISL